MTSLRFTVLGSASSFGTPAAGNDWGECDPNEPRNRRDRASLLVESETTKILIDTTPDFRHQANRFSIDRLDGILLSHSHSDHINGLDDLRVFSLKKGEKMNLYSNAETVAEMERRWPYAFQERNDGFLPFCRGHIIPSFGSLMIGDVSLNSFGQVHGGIESLGFRFGDFAYSVDMSNLSEEALAALEGVKVWVVDGGGYKRTEPWAHATLKYVEKWVDRLKPELTYVTVLSPYMDYRTLLQELPENIRPAYDGLVIEM